ncbi:MAG TPA: hypothetical protein VFH61_11195 [Thermoleophilia bacterium]|nr:hypothetical protein [Thermoleophilia bacterium]
MTDDPREILAAAGLEPPPEVVAWGEALDSGFYPFAVHKNVVAALARMVAKFGWQLDTTILDYSREVAARGGFFTPTYRDELEVLWRERTRG